MLDPEPSNIPFTEELPVVRQVYKADKLIIQQAREDVRMGRVLNVEAVCEVVGRMAVLVTDETCRQRSTPLDLDLAVQLRQATQAIASILDPICLGINPSLFLDKETT